MRLYKQAHAVYKTQYHIVWITRFRRKILTPGIASYLKIKIEEVRKHYPDWQFVEIGTDKDHLHLHMIIPPKYSVSMVIETIKKNTSRTLRQKFAHFLNQVYWDGGGIWEKDTLSQRLVSTNTLSNAMSRCRARKMLDKHSLN